jgi:hypothetical protein
MSPYYNHPTVEAVASILHDKLDADGGVRLLRAASRVRMAVAGTQHDDTRVAMALGNEGWNATTEIVDAIIEAVQQAADDNLPR